MHPFPFAVIPPRPLALRVIEDYGAMSATAAAPHYVRAENGEEYIMKGTLFSPRHPYCAPNELIVARLANNLGLPVLDHTILEMYGELFFGSHWMERPTFYPQIDAHLFQNCGNQDRVYDLAAFDVWVCNRDRHAGNLLVRQRKRSDGSEENMLLLNDHSHCPIYEGEHPSILSTIAALPVQRFFQLDFIRDAIVDGSRFSAAVDAIEHMSDHTISSAVDAAPTQWLTSQEKAAYIQFFVDRRTTLRDRLRNEMAVFANLSGGPL